MLKIRRDGDRVQLLDNMYEFLMTCRSLKLSKEKIRGMVGLNYSSFNPFYENPGASSEHILEKANINLAGYLNYQVEQLAEVCKGYQSVQIDNEERNLLIKADNDQFEYSTLLPLFLQGWEWRQVKQDIEEDR